MKTTYELRARSGGILYRSGSRSVAIKKYNTARKKQFVTLYKEQLDNKGRYQTSVVKDSMADSNKRGKLEPFEKETKVRHRRNPTKTTKFPKGKFVKVQAVRVNRDGTITVKK